MTALTYRPTDDPLIATIRQIPTGEYPTALLAERRAQFVAQIEAWNSDPDSVDIETPEVSDEMDARNSRPEPF
jgi:hypothetical protein